MLLSESISFGVLFIRSSGNTTLSASGTLLPASFSLAPAVEQINSGYKDTQSLVVTVASIVEPFLSLQHRESISQVGILVSLLHLVLLRCTETMHEPLILLLISRRRNHR